MTGQQGKVETGVTNTLLLVQSTERKKEKKGKSKGVMVVAWRECVATWCSNGWLEVVLNLLLRSTKEEKQMQEVLMEKLLGRNAYAMCFNFSLMEKKFLNFSLMDLVFDYLIKYPLFNLQLNLFLNLVRFL